MLLVLLMLVKWSKKLLQRNTKIQENENKIPNHDK